MPFESLESTWEDSQRIPEKFFVEGFVIENLGWRCEEWRVGNVVSKATLDLIIGSAIFLIIAKSFERVN